MVIDESLKSLTMTDERLVRAIKETGAKMVVLDPIQAYLGANVDMHRANQIRAVLKRLARIAEECDCAIILIGHMNKASGSKSTYPGAWLDRFSGNGPERTGGWPGKERSDSARNRP